MTKDVIALTPRMPDAHAIVAALLATGPDYRLTSVADGAVLQLCDDAGRPLLSVEAPILLQVPGEATRLLGPGTADVTAPAWWTEARASTAASHAEHLAAAFASRLAHDLDGTVWPPTSAVPVNTPAPQHLTAPEPAAAQPAVDVLTEHAAVIIQDRPVIPMTTWLSDTVRACTDSGRALQIVTPPHTRLTLPTRTVLAAIPGARWVVRDDATGYYDGLSGAVLHWHDGHFTPTTSPATPAPTFTTPATTAPEAQLLISLRTQHPADEHLLLGGALETAWQALTGHPPAGWSTAEPVNQPWSRQEITDLARHRSPDGTWLTTIGTPDHPAIATTRVTRTKDGIEEDITLALGYPPDQHPPLDALPALATELITAHRAQTILAHRRTARADLTTPPHLEPPPVPVALALGPEAIADIDPTHARNAPVPPRPAGPGLYYPLGDGTTATSWATFEHLMRHLRRP